MVTILIHFNTKCDNSGLNEQLFLKKAIFLYNYKDFKKTIHAKFQSLGENDILKYKNTLSGQV